MKSSFFAYSQKHIKQVLEQNDLPSELLKIVNKNIFKDLSYTPETWSEISSEKSIKIRKLFTFNLPRIVNTNISADNTVKFLIALADHKTIETVIIPNTKRNTICVSSQVGCAVGCKFCHTATQGLERNLTVEEIVGQFLVANRWCLDNNRPLISNLVFMGQGEPLNNFKNVKDAINILLEPSAINLSRNKVTLSTSGLVPQIKRWNEFPDINVAISLHAARNDVRSDLMPINDLHNLETLFEAIKSIPQKNSKKVSFEYLLIDEVNNLAVDIEALTNLLSPSIAKINLIPFNEYPGSPYKSPSVDNVEWFQKQLHAKGFTCTVRKRMGDDILAACGQLKSKIETENL